MQNYNYVLITPARNEAEYIQNTIQSVLEQTIIPKKWIIVSDGSTDRTDEIVRKHIEKNPWIELIRISASKNRNFASKANSFNTGYRALKSISYDIIGNLDADISFEKDYFEFLLNKFDTIPGLGVAGTPFKENSLNYNYKFTNIEHVSGACQLFRRNCFEEIGGYKLIENGGVDWVAVTSARMKGWKTKTFTEKACIHHRKIGCSKNSVLMSRFKYGQKDYYLGNHPAWELFRAFYQMGSKPYIIGGLSLISGYIWMGLRRAEKPVSEELIKFSRNEQMNRLKKILFKGLKS